MTNTYITTDRALKESEIDGQTESVGKGGHTDRRLPPVGYFLDNFSKFYN
jgi:hypothetical protein